MSGQGALLLLSRRSGHADTGEPGMRKAHIGRSGERHGIFLCMTRTQRVHRSYTVYMLICGAKLLSS